MPNRLRRPRNTVRLRLTLLYGTLFLLSGATLLGINFILVDRASQGLFVYDGKNGTATIREAPGPPRKHEPLRLDSNNPGELSPPDTVDDDVMANLARRQKEQQRQTLLVRSAIALAIMSVASIGLGWAVAGRILRRLRTITATAREISATNLHERLALPGPTDELKDLGDTFDELLARLEASFEAQRRFVANASHELRTPMARQRTLSQVAMSDPDATVESLREAHLRVIAAGRQQERLIAALLTLARGQAGLERRVPFDLARLTGQVVTARHREAERRGVTLDAAPAPAPAAGDAGLAERLVINLVDNALRHNVPRGRIDVATGTEDGRAVLTVVNSGPVVPPDAVEQLFQPFRRLGAERTRSGEGLGLGLSIVQAIATAHDADLDVTPRPEGGLAITVRFPAPAPTSQSGSGNDNGNGNQGSSGGGRGGGGGGAVVGTRAPAKRT